LIAEHRFMRTRNGAVRFARVTISSEVAPEWSVSISGALDALQADYGEAIGRGVSLAVAEQTRRAGRSHRIEVLALVETLSDTTIDAVECAAAIAAWKSFGGEAGQATEYFEAGRWSVKFNAQ
jgi:hypothetical protein